MFRNRFAVAAATAAATAVLVASPTFAGSAHFIGNLTKASLDGTSLVVQFKEAGLESGSVETVVVQAHLDATYQCINNGGTNPPDAKKTTISSDVSNSGTFPANKNGQIQGSMSIAIPSATSVLSCPGGQTATLTAGTWSSIWVSDTTSGATLGLKGSFSFGAPVGHGHK